MSKKPPVEKSTLKNLYLGVVVAVLALIGAVECSTRQAVAAEDVAPAAERPAYAALPEDLCVMNHARWQEVKEAFLSERTTPVVEAYISDLPAAHPHAVEIRRLFRELEWAERDSVNFLIALQLRHCSRKFMEEEVRPVLEANIRALEVLLAFLEDITPVAEAYAQRK